MKVQLSSQDRFWSKVKKNGNRDCWEWQGKRNYGYGLFSLRGETVRAHRMAYTLAVGPIPEGLLILHSCDNRACVNPAHLRLGTQKDNMCDRDDRNRRVVLRGEECTYSKLTSLQVLTIRSVYAAGGTSQSELGRRFGVCRATVNYIVHNKRWKSLLEGTVGQ